MKTTFKMLGSDDVWHPKAGARRGNKHALKHGRHTKEARALRARIRDFKQRVKIALALVDEQRKTRSP